MKGGKSEDFERQRLTLEGSKWNKWHVQWLATHHRFYDVCFKETCMVCEPFLSSWDMPKAWQCKIKWCFLVSHSNKSHVSLYLFTHLWAHGDRRKMGFIPCFKENCHTSILEKQTCILLILIPRPWCNNGKMEKNTTQAEPLFSFSFIHTVTNATFSGYKMMVLLTYSYICWSELLLLICCCLSCGIWWTEVCIFLQPCGITQGTNILVKNISEINLLCESKILHITDCMAWHIFLWKANVQNVNSAEIIIQKPGMISSKSHRKLCFHTFVQAYLLNMHMAMPCPRTP